MTTALKDLKGVTRAMIPALKEKGIGDNEQFAAAAATPTQRKELAELCECSTKDILEIANRADLARIKGVSGVYSDLLENAGIDTVKELAARRPDNLLEKLKTTNIAMKLTRQPPRAAQLEAWVAQAKELPRILTY